MLSWFGENKKQQYSNELAIRMDRHDICPSDSGKNSNYQQQQVDHEILKDQINILFEKFLVVLKYLKNDNVNQSELLSLNDAAVSRLKLFAASCRCKDAHTLDVVHHYFTRKKQGLDRAEQRVIKPWLDYTESALLGKKVKNLKISKIAIDKAHEYTKQGGLQGFLDSYVGAAHGSNQIVRNARQNKESLRKQNSRIAQQNQLSYQQRQGMVQCPDQNQMYNIAGGGQNIQFASSLRHPSSKYYNKEQSGSLDVEQNAIKPERMWFNLSCPNRNCPSYGRRQQMYKRDCGHKLYLDTDLNIYCDRACKWCLNGKCSGNTHLFLGEWYWDCPDCRIYRKYTLKKWCASFIRVSAGLIASLLTLSVADKEDLKVLGAIIDAVSDKMEKE